jgi:hypothetical protein
VTDLNDLAPLIERWRLAIQDLGQTAEVAAYDIDVFTRCLPDEPAEGVTGLTCTDV